MKRWTMLPAFFLMAAVGLAQNNGDGTNSVAIGDISKIDLKGKSITINNAVSYNIAPAVGGARGGAGRGGGGGGGGRGGGGRGGGGRRGGGGGGAPTGGGGFIPQTPRSFKV